MIISLNRDILYLQSGTSQSGKMIIWSSRGLKCRRSILSVLSAFLSSGTKTGKVECLTDNIELQ